MGKQHKCDKQDLNECMKLKNFELIHAFKINGEYIIGIYKGSISPFDILIKYRQKTEKGWSRIRTPKHIHWAVDILMKMQTEPQKTKKFLNFLLKIWDEIEPITSEEERRKRTNINYLLGKHKKELNEYKELSKKGEYSIKFLILLAELLMVQEKTNMQDAYMFKKLLEALGKGKDIFNIVSIATHTGR
ncbi:hypothetical protein [Persephonella sp. IF05-L8]|uniref:hypothetical protein n=1 Tax=Persephonella sp. IF05-L8 TaxID=1158338 RepID=UPI000497D448